MTTLVLEAGLGVHRRREEILIRSATVGTAAMQARHHVLLEHEPVIDSEPWPVCSTCRGADGSRLTYPCRTSDVVQGALDAALLRPERGERPPPQSSSPCGSMVFDPAG